ncbi:hypothetical protein VTN77DRAFT_5206 [Rasamsonia byssochlamydoides]|uniref:uncharacterized protein n=1 Tax=Rasamsonia byssochlamydoides TaxID=89139 RepID=UPI003743A938
MTKRTMGAYSGYGYRCSMSIASAASSIQCHRQTNTNETIQLNFAVVTYAIEENSFLLERSVEGIQIPNARHFLHVGQKICYCSLGDMRFEIFLSACKSGYQRDPGCPVIRLAAGMTSLESPKRHLHPTILVELTVALHRCPSSSNSSKLEGLEGRYQVGNCFLARQS